MKKVLFSFLTCLFIFQTYSQEVIQMKKEGGVYTVPCEINGLRLRFIFDTGASEVTISAAEAVFMLKHGYLSREDITGSSYYQVANGDIVEGTTIVLKRLKIGTKTIYNVKASVSHSVDAPLLLGQSALSRFGKISFDYSNNQLVLGESSGNTNRSVNSNRPTESIYRSSSTSASAPDSYSRFATKKNGITRTEVNVFKRYKPVPSGLLTKASKGRKVQVLGRAGQFYYIKMTYISGFVLASQITITN